MDSSGNNRYELLFMDDDITDPLDNIVAKKKQAKSAAAGGGGGGGGAGSGANTKANTSSGKQNNHVDGSSRAQQAHKKQPNQAEKENKPSAMNKNDSGGNKRATAGGGAASVSFNDKVSSRPIGASNVNSNGNRKRNGPQSTEIREGGGGGGQGRNPTFRQQNGETREQRNNRRNNGFNNSTAAGGTAAVTDGSQQQQRQFRERGENRGPPRANNRNFDANNRGRKREFDRQSGSDKTGVKAIDKRDGAGARNWGSVKDAIDELNKTDAETVEKADESINEAQQPVEQAPVEEETKELTFDEWKAQKQQRAKPQFNIRKAGEGEDTSQWKKMIALNNNKKKDVESEEELEYDPAMYPQRVGRQQRLLDIQFNFNDGRRGGGGFGGRGRGRGPRPGGFNAGGGGGGGGSGNGNGGGGGNMMANGERGGGGGSGGGGVSNGVNVGTGGGGGDRQRAAPKVNDERQFPTLA